MSRLVNEHVIKRALEKRKFKYLNLFKKGNKFFGTLDNFKRSGANWTCTNPDTKTIELLN